MNLTFRGMVSGRSLVHLTIVVILAGACVDHFLGTQQETWLKVSHDDSRTWQQVIGELDVAAAMFDVKSYPPDYAMYRAVATAAVPRIAVSDVASEALDYELIGKVRPADDGSVQAGRHGSLPPGSLLFPGGGDRWSTQAVMPDGTLLHALNRVDSDYLLNLLVNPTGSDTAATASLLVRVNHPAEYRGWRFYLMSYDRATRDAVLVRIRRAPGRSTVFTGILLLVIGTCLSCFGGRQPERPQAGNPDMVRE